MPVHTSRTCWTELSPEMSMTDTSAKETPTGDKINFTDGAVATYDFSDHERKFQWGVQVGADWKAYKHLKVYTHLTWGLNDLFEKDFQTITFAMYPIYLNLGFGYTF